MPGYNNPAPGFYPGQQSLVPRLLMDYVSGETEARAYQIDRGCLAALFDRERPVFYLKEVGFDGKSGSFKICDYAERPEPQPVDPTRFATKEDVRAIVAELIGGMQNVQSRVSSGAAPAPAAATAAYQPAGPQPGANAGDVQRLRGPVPGERGAAGQGNAQLWPNESGAV